MACMADIYSKAKIVVMWLGPESYDSPQAIEAMQWIGQEARLASSPPFIICENRLLHWTSNGATVFLLQTPKRREFILESDTEAKSELCILKINLLSENESHHPFLTLLIQTQLCLCTDPRDRIFALLSLLKKSNKDIGIQPDYSKNVRKVYEHAMLQLVTHDKRLDFLIMVERLEIHENTASLPS